MDPLVIILVPGIVGGAVIAVLIYALQRRGDRVAASSPFDRLPISTDVINMAHIRVAGIGGLGLVAMAAVVALVVPRIGQTLAVGMVLGGFLALALIVVHRRR